MAYYPVHHHSFPCDLQGMPCEEYGHFAMPRYRTPPVYPYALNYPVMPPGYADGCGPMVVIPGGARGPPGPGYGCHRAPYTQPVGVCPSAVGGTSTKEDRIAFLAGEIKKSIQEREEVIQDNEKLEVTLAEFLLMATQKVTEQAKESYEKGYESGTARERKRALEKEYKELTGTWFMDQGR